MLCAKMLKEKALNLINDPFFFLPLNVFMHKKAQIDIFTCESSVVEVPFFCVWRIIFIKGFNYA